MEKILKEIDFFVDFLLNKNQQDEAIFIRENKEKIASYFNEKNERINKCFTFLSLWNNKIYIHYRSNKNQKWQIHYLNLTEIENIKIKNKIKKETLLEKL